MGLFQRVFKKNTAISSYFQGLSTINSKYISIQSKDDILTAYKINPTIRAIVERKASLFSNITIKEVNNNDEEIIESPLLSLIENAHPFYSGNQFLYTIGKQLSLFGVCYIFANRSNLGGLVNENDTFLVLPANDVTEIYKDFDIKEIKNKDDYISHYNFYFKGNNIIFEPYEIMKIGGIAFENFDFENIQTLESAVNIISSAYNVRNTLQRRNGGFGIMTNEKSSATADMFNTDIEIDEINKIQKDLKKYSFNREDYNLIITNASLKYQAITYPIKDMALNEAVMQARVDICDVMNYPILALNDMAGATFANMEISDKKIYTDSIIPLWEITNSEFNRQNLTLKKIVFDYSHIQSLQLDRKTNLETKQINDDIEINRFEKGIITFNEMRVAMGLEELSGGDYYYSQPKITENVQDETNK